MTILLSIIRQLGFTGCGIALALLYYEGIPGINRLPFVDQIPLIREFGVGRVELERREAVKSMVTQAEYDALSAVLSRERALKAAADKAATEAKKRADSLRVAKEAQDERIRELTAEALKAEGLSTPTEKDLQWPERPH